MTKANAHAALTAQLALNETRRNRVHAARAAVAAAETAFSAACAASSCEDDDDFFGSLLANDEDPQVVAAETALEAARAELDAALAAAPHMVESDTETETVRAFRGNCHRCGGAGRIACYIHVSQGVCFACGGTGIA